jgi:hypothetical protein
VRHPAKAHLLNFEQLSDGIQSGLMVIVGDVTDLGDPGQRVSGSNNHPSHTLQTL